MSLGMREFLPIAFSIIDASLFLDIFAFMIFGHVG